MTQDADYVPRLLDLFCCAGGAAMGYHRAGWMTGQELNEAIPPAYTEYIGLQLRAAAELREAA